MSPDEMVERTVETARTRLTAEFRAMGVTRMPRDPAWHGALLDGWGERVHVLCPETDCDWSREVERIGVAYDELLEHMTTHYPDPGVTTKPEAHSGR